ncbi:hypothetical protein M5J20_04405 [Corynebacterium sp. TA-R-1]|uniref:Uncharacterized protein n=1 Tax=Corynebacterium stercoris TaxID=2943490 RepID=A0ABT1G076_9CORY|nr:hypothetical protein [Corynebacterium stercoris]MCP1387429.1 hypothetical protein [Corynebacterium stercoris]
MNPFERALAETPDYVPNYLTRVTPGAFTLADGAWRTTALSREGAPVDYALRIDDAGTVTEVRVNGDVVSDLPSLAERPETVLEWFDAIAYLDARGRVEETVDPRWTGDDIATAMERAGQNVVAFSEHPVRLSAFDNPAPCEAYVNAILAPTPLRATVRPVRSWPIDDADFEHGDFTLRIATCEEDGFYPMPYSTDYYPAGWYEILEDQGWRSFMEASFSDFGENAAADDVEAAVAYRLSQLPGYVEIGMPSENAEWWALTFPRLDVLFLVSPAETVLNFTIDGDNSHVRVEILFGRTYARRQRLQDRYQRRWGHLANDAVPHTDAEIAAAVDAALNAIGGNRAD